MAIDSASVTLHHTSPLIFLAIQMFYNNWVLFCSILNNLSPRKLVPFSKTTYSSFYSAYVMDQHLVVCCTFMCGLCVIIIKKITLYISDVAAIISHINSDFRLIRVVFT